MATHSKRSAAIVGLLVLGVLALGVGAGLGAGGESDAEHETGALAAVEWAGDAPDIVAPADTPDGTETTTDGNARADSDDSGADERGGDDTEFDDEVREVDLEELGTLDEPGIYSVDVSDIDTVELVVEGAGGGGAGYDPDDDGDAEDGGPGGYVEGTWDVSEFDELEITVGSGGGGGDMAFGPGDGGGGFYEGGDGGFDEDHTGGGGGGGATVVEGVDSFGNTAQLAAAGGGGGGSAWDDWTSGTGSDESGGGGGAPGGEGGETTTFGGSDGEDAEESDGPIPNTIGAPGADADDDEAFAGGLGGAWVNSDYAQDWEFDTGGGSSGGEGGAFFGGELGESGDAGTVDVTTPNVVIQSTDAPDEIEPGESLVVEYTLSETSGIDAEESFVDLYVDGSLEEWDSNVAVPGGGTASGSLSFDDTGSYSDGDTIDWAVELFDFDDTDGDTTEVVEPPEITIQSTDAPGTVEAGEDLVVEYTLENDGGDGEESFVDLYVDGDLWTWDSGVFVPGGGTTSGSLTFDDTGSYSDGDTIDWEVVLVDSGDTDGSTTDVFEEPDISIQSTDAPDEIAIDETLFVEYTLVNDGGDGTESSVNLLVDGRFEDDDSDVFVPGGGTNGGTLVYDDVESDFDFGETVPWTVELSDSGDTESDTTDIEASPPEFLVGIQSTNDPVVEGETLVVDVEIENVGGESGTQTVTLDVDRLGEDSESVALSGESSTVESFEIETGSGDADDYIAAVASEDDSDSTGVTVLAAATFEVEILSTNEPVEEGETLVVDADIENTGDVADAQVVELVVPGVGEDSTAIELDGGDSTLETFEVGTGGADGGEYLAEVVSDDDTDSESVTVLAPAEFTVEILSTDDPVVEGEDLTVDAEIENVGDVEDVQEVALDVPELGDDSAVVELDGGSSTVETFTVGTSSGDVGEYTAEVETEDDTDTESVTVLAPAAFAVEILTTNGPVVEGETLTVDAEIENAGDIEDAQVVELDVPGLGDDSTAIELDGGDSTVETFTVGTSSGDAGGYTAEVTSDDDTDTESVTVLAPAEFEVAITSANEPVEGEELTVAAEISNVGDVEETQTVALDAGALGADETHVTLSGGASTEETLTVGTESGDAGEYTAEVASDDDTDTESVTVLEDVTFEVTITDATAPVEGEELAVTAEITNTGEAEGTGTVSLSVSELGGDEIAVTLGPEESTEETLAVGTESGDAGEYTAEVATDDDTDTESVTVLAQASFDVSILDADDPVEGQDIDVTVEIANVGDVEDSQSITLDVGVLGGDEMEVTLAGGASTEETLTVGTNEGDAGTYTATVASEDDSEETAVELLQQATFAVTITGAGEPAEGEPLDVTVLVENVGDVEGTGTVTLDVGALGGDETDVTLSGGASTEEMLTVGTEEGDAGTYTAAVTSADDEDSQEVTVLEAPEFTVDIVGTSVSGSALDVIYQVENVGEVEDTQTVTFSVDEEPEDGREHTLAAGGDIQDTFTYGIQAGDAPELPLEVASLDDREGQTVSIEPADLALTFVEADTSVVEGDDLELVVEATNVGEEPADETLELFDIDGTAVDEEAVSLAGEESVEEPLVWTTEAGDAGSGEVTVGSDTAEAVTESVEVLAQAAFTVDIVDTTEPIVGDDLEVTVQVENVGDVPDSQTISLDVGGLGEDSTEVSLDGGESTEEGLSVGTDEGDVGEYTAEVASEDDTDAETVTVLSESAFTVTITDTAEPVEGEELAVTVDVENIGDVVDTQTVALDVPGLGSDEVELTLDGGESTEEALSVDTDEGEAGEYTATVASEDDSDSATVTVLEQATFEVAIVEIELPAVGQQLDVTAEVENVGEVPDTRTLTFSVDGDTEDEREQTLDPGESKQEAFTYEIQAGDAPELPLAVASEDDSDQATVDIAPAELALTFVEADTSVVEGEDLAVTVEATNVGDEPADETLELLDIEGAVVDDQSVELAGGETTEATLVWATEPGDAGSGEVTIDSETAEAVTESVEVLEQATFAVDIVDVPEPVEGERIDIVVEVDNTGEVADTQTVSLDIGLLGQDATEVSLEGGESSEESLSVDTDEGDSGEYEATVTSADDSDSATVTVFQADEFAVEIVEMDETVVEGENLTLTVAVTNVGEGPGTQLLTVDAGVHGSVELELELAGGASTEETVEFSTEQQQLGTQNVTVATADDIVTESVEVHLPTLPGQGGPPTDQTGDGLHEDVDGDGEFTIFDIQTFFNHFESPDVQNHAWAFNFNEDDGISIFDVQALFNRL